MNLNEYDLWGGSDIAKITPSEQPSLAGYTSRGTFKVSGDAGRFKGGQEYTLYEKQEQPLSSDGMKFRESAVKQIGFDPLAYNPREEAIKDYNSNVSALFQQVTGGRKGINDLTPSEQARWNGVVKQYINDRYNFHNQKQVGGANYLKNMTDMYYKERALNKPQKDTTSKEFKSAIYALDSLYKTKASIQKGIDPIMGTQIPQENMEAALATIQKQIDDRENFIQYEYPDMWEKYRTVTGESRANKEGKTMETTKNIIEKLPPGAKLTNRTYMGKKVYETPDGKRYYEE